MPKGMFNMKAYFKRMSMLFMALAVISSLAVGLNISKAKSFSASVIDSVFPLECSVEYRESGEIVENARVTFNHDAVVIKSGGVSHTVNINDVILTGCEKSQRVENAVRAFMLFVLVMILAVSLPFALICISLNYRFAYLACTHAKSAENHRVLRGKNAEARPAPTAA